MISKNFHYGYFHSLLEDSICCQVSSCLFRVIQLLDAQCMRKHTGSHVFRSQLHSQPLCSPSNHLFSLPPPNQDDQDGLNYSKSSSCVTVLLYRTYWWCINTKRWWHISSGISAKKGCGHRTGWLHMSSHLVDRSRGNQWPCKFPPLGRTAMFAKATFAHEPCLDCHWRLPTIN